MNYSDSTDIYKVLLLSDLHLGKTADATAISNRHKWWISAPRVILLAVRAALAFVAFNPERRWHWRRLRLGLTGTHNSKAFSDLKQYLREMAKARTQFDAVLISGDISTLGERDSLEHARSLCDDLALEIGDIPIFVLPGNHDRFHTALNAPGSPFFEARTAFTNQWNIGNANVISNGKRVKCFQLRKKNNTLSILAADFTLKRKSVSRWKMIFNFTFHLHRGKVYSERLNGLVQITDREINRGNAVVWAVHFPPAYPNKKPIIGWRELLKAAEGRVKYLLSGHMHNEKTYRVSEPRSSIAHLGVICAGTTLSCGYNLSFFEIDIHVGAGNVAKIAHTLHAWDPKRGKSGWHILGPLTEFAF